MKKHIRTIREFLINEFEITQREIEKCKLNGWDESPYWSRLEKIDKVIQSCSFLEKKVDHLGNKEKTFE
jgi:hypothetical protein